MKALKDKPNTVPAGGDYPYGDLRDNPGNNTGTPYNRELFGDIQRTVEKIMDEAGIVANGMDDNETNGYQIYEAIVKAIKGYQVTSFIFNPINSGNEITMLTDELELGFVSYNKVGAGSYQILWTDVSAITSNVVYNHVGINLTSEIYYQAEFTGSPNPQTMEILVGDGNTLVEPTKKTVVEIRKYY